MKTMEQTGNCRDKHLVQGGWTFMNSIAFYQILCGTLISIPVASEFGKRTTEQWKRLFTQGQEQIGHLTYREISL